MNARHTLFHLERSPFNLGGIALHISVKHSDGTLSRVTNMTLEKHDPLTTVHYEDPVLSLSESDAQDLIDELWHLGIRPTEGHGSTGQLAAVEKHRDHLTRLLDQTLSTVCNVVNAPLLAQAQSKAAGDAT